VACVPDEYLEQTAFIGDEQRNPSAVGFLVAAAAQHRPDRRRTRGRGTPPGGESKGRIMTYETIAIDAPADRLARITLNRPEKRNAISARMRVELLDALRSHDQDPGVRVTIIRGAGVCFSAGYDLAGGPMMEGRAVLLRARGRAVGAPVQRHLVQHLGPGQAGHRPGARLRHRRSHRAGLRVRPRLRRRRRGDQLPGGADHEPARLAVPQPCCWACAARWSSC